MQLYQNSCKLFDLQLGSTRLVALGWRVVPSLPALVACIEHIEVCKPFHIVCQLASCGHRAERANKFSTCLHARNFDKLMSRGIVPSMTFDGMCHCPERASRSSHLCKGERASLADRFLRCRPLCRACWKVPVFVQALLHRLTGRHVMPLCHQVLTGICGGCV